MLIQLIKNLKERSEESEKNYLDARYWDLIFKDYPRFGTLNMNIFEENGFSTSLDYYDKLNDSKYPKYYELDNYPIIIRLRIEMYNKIHNNLILIDEEVKEIIRYEPESKDNYVDKFIKRIIRIFFGKSEDYLYREEFGNYDDTMCVARCIVNALEYISNEELNLNIYECSNIIEKTYGIIPGSPVIELGRENVLPGALVGGLGGGLVGGLVGGPAGFAVGALGGGLIGGTVGYLS